MIMRFKNGELRYYINGEDLENIVKIPLINKGDFYLFIQCRSEKSKAKIDYITEIFDWLFQIYKFFCVTTPLSDNAIFSLILYIIHKN